MKIERFKSEEPDSLQKNQSDELPANVEKDGKLITSEEPKSGTAERTCCDLMKAIAINEKSLLENPDNEILKNLLDELKLQVEVLNSVRKKKILTRANVSGKTLDEKQLQEKAKKISAGDMWEPIQDLIDRLEESRDRGNNHEQLEGSNDLIPLDALRKAASDLQARLANEASRKDSEEGKLVFEQEEDSGKIQKVREGIFLESSSEREKDREKIIKDILENGGFSVNMSFEAQNIAKGQGEDGFQFIKERDKDWNQIRTFSKVVECLTTEKEENGGIRDLNRVMRDHNIRELVDIRPLEDQKKREISQSGKRGFLGSLFGKGKASFGPFPGYKQAIHSDYVKNGKEESAFIITYKAADIPGDEKTNREWISKVNGRPGQTIEVCLIIPKSIVTGFKEEIDVDPSFIRKVVEIIMKEKLLAKPKAWDNSMPIQGGGTANALKPPYKEWDAAKNGGFIYIQDYVQKHDISRGYHKEFLKGFKGI
ncbi:MAG: hypothetical protein WC178_02035 [Candidatus Paceibacterota bacterium]